MATPSDPFKKPRTEKGVLRCEFQGEKIPMILRHADVRAAAKDWKTYSSDAPFRVPIPSEEDMRRMRQLPIETDPPEHTEYRKIVEPFFKRAKNPEVIANVDSLIRRHIDTAITSGETEIVRTFALPIQSHALTYLLNVPDSEAETWISWGTHVFHDGDSSEQKGTALENYLIQQFDQADGSDGDDFFSTISRATFQDQRLTRDEMLGFANLTFAGGRDTIINTITCIIAHIAENPDALDFLREEPKRIVNAGEEFFRTITPLTHIGRVCPVDTDVHGEQVPPKGRTSLCWASANYDPAAFEAPEETRLDRKPNPHLAFGAGAHLCLGAPHARLITRTLLAALCDRVETIEITDAKELVEQTPEYSRKVGYDSLKVNIVARH